MKIYGTHDAQTIRQLQTCIDAEPDSALGVLCADGHVGYSMPIGGVVAYRKFISPSGVGYDIGCGNMAVRTPLTSDDIDKELPRLADEIESRISFGIGRKNNEPVDDSIFELIHQSSVVEQRALLPLAQTQLGTVGSGNHYVDVLVDTQGFVWVACHFGSRGFGHKTAKMFMALAQGLPMTATAKDGEMMSPPLLLHLDSPIGQDYKTAMMIAGEYAYAGRRQVIQKVLDILGTHAVDTVHNHHNYAWTEQHNGKMYTVVRKGATPAFPNQRGFIGGSMLDISVIVHGVDSQESRDSLYSTVHGAGRVLSRNQAIKGTFQWRCSSPDCCKTWKTPVQPPKDLRCPEHGILLQKEQLKDPVNFAACRQSMERHGVVLRGAGPDEAPQCYRPLSDVLLAHDQTIVVETYLMPRIVVMAGKDVKDPYKD